MKKTLAELAELIDAEIVGDEACEISSLATLQQAGEGDLTFFHSKAYKDQLANTKASAVIISKDDRALCPVHALVVDDPYFSYSQVGKLFEFRESFSKGIHASVVTGKDCSIADDVSLGANVVLGDCVSIASGTVVAANTVIGSHCQIGKDCKIDANVSIYHHVAMGDRVTLYSGVVLGSDGFGNAMHQGEWHKIPHVGGVAIGNDVEIGSCTTIDRGTLGNTKIGNGVKLDNLIHLAHNVEVGDHTVMAACTGVAGSAKIGSHCMIGGHVSMNGHITIADKTIIMATSMVPSSIKEPNIYSSGTGLMPMNIWKKSIVRFKQLDKLAKRIKALEIKVRGKNDDKN